MLTKQQATALAAIRAHLEAQGYSPSYEEIRVSLGLRAKSGVKLLVDALVERGALRRSPRRARSLELVQQDCAGPVANRGIAEALAADLTTVLRMVRTNMRIERGAPGRAWDGDFLLRRVEAAIELGEAAR